MRLHPTLMQTAARCIALPSRRSSSPSFRSAFTEISNAILRSNIRWRGKSFAASVPSGLFKPQKVYKRIPKQERRAMVESFVDKYRALNAGRFPTASHIRKETGGSYYTVRQIVQELEYNHKVSPSSEVNEIKLGKVEKAIRPNSGVKEEPPISKVEGILSPTADEVISSTELLDSIQINEYPLVKDIKTIAHLEAKEEHQILEEFGDPSISSARVNTEVCKKDIVPNLVEERLQNNNQDFSGDQESKASSDTTQIAQADISLSLKSEVIIETPSSPTGVTEGGQKHTGATECLQNASNPRLKLTENHKVPKHEELNSAQGESSTKAVGFWGNLKSLAHGIVGFWKM